VIYIIPMILILIFLAWFFRDEIKDSLSEYLAMVCIGALFWSVTVIWMVKIWFEWRRE